MTTEEIKNYLGCVKIGEFEYSLRYLDMMRKVYMADTVHFHDVAFVYLDIEDEMEFANYYYHAELGSWPTAPNTPEGLEGLYKLVRELKFRYTLKEKGLKYYFDDCKKGDCIRIETKNKQFYFYTIQDNRCLLDSKDYYKNLINNIRMSDLADVADVVKDIKITNCLEDFGISVEEPVRTLELKNKFEQIQPQDYENLTLKDVEDNLMEMIKTACTPVYSEKSLESKIRIRKNKYNFKINKNI